MKKIDFVVYIKKWQPTGKFWFSIHTHIQRYESQASFKTFAAAKAGAWRRIHSECAAYKAEIGTVLVNPEGPLA